MQHKHREDFFSGLWTTGKNNRIDVGKFLLLLNLEHLSLSFFFLAPVENLHVIGPPYLPRGPRRSFCVLSLREIGHLAPEIAQEYFTI